MIVNAAVTGMVPTKRDSAAVPITPDEIAENAECCVRAGASIVHLHARDRAGEPTYRADAYAEIVSRVRERCPDVVICVSTSGRVHKTLEERSEVLGLDGDERPELASLTLGSLNFPRQASVNDPAMIQALAERMAERGIVPELEVFDLGMVDYAKHLIGRGVLRPPHYFNILLGSLGTLSASAFNIGLVAEALPSGSTWAGAGIGRFQLQVNALAIAAGGHVRVGLEDNLWLDNAKTKPATNLALVERVVGIARAMGREIATPAETRAVVGLPARAGA